MKKFLTAALMILFVAMCAGCGEEKINTEPQKISQEKAMEMLAADPNAKLLDCRFAKDYDARHIPNAVHFPLEAAVGENFEKIPNKNDTLITYCGDGNRGRLTGKVLLEKGYKNVYTMGGIIDWKGDVEGTEVETAENQNAESKDVEAQAAEIQ